MTSSNRLNFNQNKTTNLCQWTTPMDVSSIYKWQMESMKNELMNYPFAEDSVLDFRNNRGVWQRRLGRHRHHFAWLSCRLANHFRQLAKHLQQFRCAGWVQLRRHLALWNTQKLNQIVFINKKSKGNELNLHEQGEVPVNWFVINSTAIGRFGLSFKLGDPFK